MTNIRKMMTTSKKYVMVFYTSFPLTNESVIEFKTSSKNPKEDRYYVRYTEKRGKELSKQLKRKVYYGIITNPKEFWEWNR